MHLELGKERSNVVVCSPYTSGFPKDYSCSSGWVEPNPSRPNMLTGLAWAFLFLFIFLQLGLAYCKFQPNGLELQTVNLISNLERETSPENSH